MKKLLLIAAAIMTVAVSTTANAAPLGSIAGGISGGAAASQDSIVETVQYAYSRVCTYGPRGWFVRNYRGEIISCRPRRPIGFGWDWREEGGRSGWYHRRDRRWR
jgi:hypothetical protein